MTDDMETAAARLGLPGLGSDQPARRRPRGAPAAVEPRRRAAEIALVTRCVHGDLPRARVLAESVRRFHPEIDVFVVVVDPRPQTPSRLGPAEVIAADVLGVEGLDFLRCALSAADLCAAIKPASCRFAVGLGYTTVLCCDATTDVHAPLRALLEALAVHPFVATPRLLAPFAASARSWEHPDLFAVAGAGLLDSGLFGLTGAAENLAVLAHWEAVLLAPGAFLAPHAAAVAFDLLSTVADRFFVLRDAAYGVGFHNLHDRSLRWASLDGGDAATWTVDGRPLVTACLPDLPVEDPWCIGAHSWGQSVYLFPSMATLVAAYLQRLQAPAGSAPAASYGFARLPCGQLLDARLRRALWRCQPHLGRGAEPFSSEGEDACCRALLRPAPGTYLVPALLWEIYLDRPDLQLHFPEARVRPQRLIEWFSTDGAAELGYTTLLDRFRPTLPRREVCLHLADLVVGQPSAWGDLAAPLGRDRSAFMLRLEQAGMTSEANGVRALAAEIWAPCLLAAVRELVTSRPDLRRAFPDFWGQHAEALADWLETDGRRDHLLPPGAGELLRRKAGGRALGRLYSFYRRHPSLMAAFPFAFVGEQSEALAAAILEQWPIDCEVDLDDVAMFLWVMAERPFEGVGATLELPVHAGRQPSPLLPEGQDALLAPFLDRPGFRDALERYRAEVAPDRRPGLWRQRREGREASVLATVPSPWVPPPVAPRPGVNCFGFFQSPVGLGNLSRGLALALAGAGLDVARQLVGLAEMSDEVRLADFVGSYRHDFDLNLFVSHPHLHYRLLASEPAVRVSGRRNIAYLAWEQRDGHPFWRDVFADLDQLWALSGFAAEAIGRACGREVRVVPPVVDCDGLPPAAKKSEVGLDPTRCSFLFVFDAHSRIERKNPSAVIEAMRRAFTPEDRVELVIKASHAGRSEYGSQLQRLEDLAARSGLQIRFDTRTLPQADLLRLISAADVYVSLHRAEGFGYTCAEAMAYGVPVIATGYSGNLDFMDDGTSFLVRASEVEVAVPDGPFQRGSVWAEPDVDHAAALLQRVCADLAAARVAGARGAARVRERLSVAAVASAIRDAIGGSEAR